ncbi:MAG: histidine kinase, partial [Burkholderiaceae bacterium]|nr:histidine kinase [Burkholderiaceae bacterium]
MTDSLLSQFFRARAEAAPLLVVTYDSGLVALSVLVACLGGVAALQLVDVARHPERFGARIAAAACALAVLAFGVSVWSMHFIGMLAVDICRSVRFDAGVTAASMLPALLGSYLGLRPLMRPGAPMPLSRGQIALSGVWIGAGIGAMHYTGMAAMRTDGL